VTDPDVAGQCVEGVADLEDLLSIGVAKGQSSADYVFPVRALAAGVREPFINGVASMSSRNDMPRADQPSS
jgi:hypothetical protein